MAKVMAAVRDAETIESLVTLACQVASGMEADLIALHVTEIPMATPIDADDELLDHPGKDILQRAQLYAAQHFSRKIATRLLRARRAGEAIVGEAQEQGINCLVMGHVRRSRVEEVLLGSNVQYVARHAPCQIVVCIPATRIP